MLILIFVGLILFGAFGLTIYTNWKRKKKVRRFIEKVKHEKDIRILKEALERLNRDIN